MFSRISFSTHLQPSRWRIPSLRASSSSKLAGHTPAGPCRAPMCLNQVRTIAGGHSGAFNQKASSSNRRGGLGRIPLAAIGLIGGGLVVTGVGLWQFYTSNVNKFPPAIRDDLRKALYYQNYGNDHSKAVDYYRSALEAALVHPDLATDGPEVTGIMIQFGTLLQDMGRTRDAIDVLTACFEALVHGRPLSPKYGHLQKTAATAVDSQGQMEQQQQQQDEEALLWHGVEDITEAGDDAAIVPAPEEIPKHHHAGVAHLDGPTRLKTIGVAQKLGDLHLKLKQDKEAERFYVWSVEQLLRDYGDDDLKGRSSKDKSNNNNNNGNSDVTWSKDTLAQDREQMKKQFDFDNLPAWMSKTDLGASLEALAGFYAKKGQYRNAIVLYSKALRLSDPQSSCHASVIMCNLSDAFAGIGQVDEAMRWAQRGLDVSTSLSGQECDESCGVILYNLGMLNEIKGNIAKAEEFYRKSRKHGAETGYKDCVLQSNKALKRLKEGTH
ncbi:hypothetical protein BGW42_005871 [Actinomortierella wolfii]|nr:hypothetical protein BGW42_005871 [Actinomortierella wolfii]